MGTIVIAIIKVFPPRNRNTCKAYANKYTLDYAKVVFIAIVPN